MPNQPNKKQPSTPKPPQKQQLTKCSQHAFEAGLYILGSKCPSSTLFFLYFFKLTKNNPKAPQIYQNVEWKTGGLALTQLLEIHKCHRFNLLSEIIKSASDWGFFVWSLFLATSEIMDDSIYHQYLFSRILFFSISVLPCLECSKHFHKIIQTQNIKSYATGSQFILALHNEVNKVIKKPQKLSIEINFTPQSQITLKSKPKKGCPCRSKLAK